jgi:ribosomal protein L7/L12
LPLLSQSKALVDKLPSVLKDEMPKEEAEQWKKKLEELGATIELQ